MISFQSYVQQGKHTLRRWVLNPKAHSCLRAGLHILSGFLLSAASLANAPLPLSMALVCACSGWPAVLVAAGGAAGLLLFWGAAGRPGVCWLGGGLLLALLLADRRLTRQAPFLLPALAGLCVSLCGVLFQVLTGQGVPLPVYLIQILFAIGVTWLLTQVLRGRNPILDWLACSLAVLALAQIMPIPYLGLGYLAAGAVCVAAPFPAAALSGLALDLAQVTPVPMTAVMALAYLVRFLPRYPSRIGRLAPAAVYIAVMYLCGKPDLQPLPGLLLGGLAGALLPAPTKAARRRGETGVAQVRLELAAGVLSQTQQLLLEVPVVPVDEDALVAKAADRACGGCPYRNSCKERLSIGQLSGSLLHMPLLDARELPIVCRKSGRYLTELHRSQEQLRAIHADRTRQKEYRAAVIQQYRFLASFLQELSDQLTQRAEPSGDHYSCQVFLYGNRPEYDNGDRCLRFPGVGNRYYVLLCDGMGTGLGAVQEGRTAGLLLRRLLTAGFPARHALRSLNSLCALRERAAAVTADLLEAELDTGRATLYKWGAAPSYLLTDAGAERVGAPTPPPGLSVAEDRQNVWKLTLRQQQLLLMVSDGISQEEVLRCCDAVPSRDPETLATELLTCSPPDRQDDATVVLVRLLPKE